MFSTLANIFTELRQDLRNHPLALALCIVNALFIAVVIVTLQSVAAGVERRDTIISKLIEHQCP